VRVTATHKETGATLTATTDNYGDFWLKDLKEGAYTILMQKDGYLAKKLGPVEVATTDHNLGDIALWQS